MAAGCRVPDVVDVKEARVAEEPHERAGCTAGGVRVFGSVVDATRLAVWAVGVGGRVMRTASPWPPLRLAVYIHPNFS